MEEKEEEEEARNEMAQEQQQKLKNLNPRRGISIGVNAKGICIIIFSQWMVMLMMV